MISAADDVFCLTKHCMKTYGRNKEFLTVVVYVSEELVKMRLEYGVIGLNCLQHLPR